MPILEAQTVPTLIFTFKNDGKSAKNFILAVQFFHFFHLPLCCIYCIFISIRNNRNVLPQQL